MTMSMAAKAAWALLWTECDDNGVFEWKPVVLKARIFPAESVDFSAILDEYAALGCVRKFEVDGKPFGVIKNFGKWQRPKHPSYRHTLPDHLRSFSGSPHPVGGEASPSPTEIGAQRKEEGGREEEGKDIYQNNLQECRASADVVPLHPNAYAVFPEHGPVGHGPWGELFRRVWPGRDVDLIADAYRVFCRNMKIPWDDPHHEKRATTWATNRSGKKRGTA
jgi:hypothetical protein